MDDAIVMVPLMLVPILIYMVNLMVNLTVNLKNRQTYYVKKLYVYPIKSCHRVSVDKIELTKGGIKHDRVFCLLDENNNVLNQRKLSKMATIVPQILEDQNILRIRSKSSDKFLSTDFGLK